MILIRILTNKPTTPNIPHVADQVTVTTHLINIVAPDKQNL